MKPAATLALALAALAAAVAFERALAPTADAATVERLVPQGALAGRTLAAISLRTAGDELLYLRSQGRWRSREAFGAPCEAARMEELLGAVLEARGVEVCAGEACAARLGFDAPGALTIGLHGPGVLRAADRDLLLAVELAAGPGTLARRADSERVLGIDRDPRALVARAGALPPFLDQALLAASLPQDFRGFERLALEEGARRFELVPLAERSEDWRLVQDGAAQPALVWRVGGWISLFVRLRWDEVHDPRLAAALGADPPRARVTLAPRAGEPVELWISAPDAANRVHVWNRRTNVLVSVRAELGPLLVPAAEDFTQAEGGNPWEAWLAPR